MSSFHEQIEDAVRAVEIVSPTRYTWLGQPSDPLPEHVEERLSPEESRGYLQYGLESRLYGDFYCRGHATLPAQRAPTDHIRGDPALVAALSGSHAGRGCWEPGWTLRGMEGDKAVVERDGLVLRASRAECRGLPPRRTAAGRAPAQIEVLYPKELLRVSPGFYTALCDRPFDGSEGIVRVYWNIASGAAVAFVKNATTLLNRASSGARFKVANDPALYDRCDSAVLYLPRADAMRAGKVVRALHAAVAEQLGARVPAFTRRLAPGVGLAEDPGGSLSFGQSRCHVLADGLIRAYERGTPSVSGRVDVVKATFEERGIDPAAPYLNPGSVDEYDLEIDERSASPAR
jgi:hypothetical protein